MSHKHVQSGTRAALECGDLAGKSLQFIAEYPEGVVAQQRDGKRIFLPKVFCTILAVRNQGKG